MRAIGLAAAMILAATPALAADPVEGEWLTQGGSGRVKIGPCPGAPQKMCGVLVWLRQAGAKDANNPDPALRSRPVQGITLVRDFRQAGPGRWTGGKIYDPEGGKTYDSKMRVNPDGTLKVEGCVLVICRAQTWKRAS